ncbi:arginase family protein [Frigoribacterium sp. Leaf172]|uniref:arginase family protein n=1 Tax=Frigoribacterium sp. Leaf172 TaxID=1736285 RepID=UPI0006FB0F88|nr:arginase family protein [Frigoribacterium sp. Leaf172]KQR66018.1 arginase [Frigoribacterium sp. Leaf172]
MNSIIPSTTLRLIWPQWQGATAEMVAELAPEFPLETARRGYAVGTEVLQAVLPQHDGPTAVVPVDMGNEGLQERDGLEAKEAVVRQLSKAVELVREHAPERILTLGGECSVSVAPFTSLAAKYGDDLAVLWVDSHPDIGTGTSDYHGYHAMAVSAITGHGDQDILDELPATVPAARVALVGLHDWTDDDFPNVADWGLSTFTPDDLRSGTNALVEWLKSTGATKVAIHLDVDTIDSNEVVLGLGAVPDGLTSVQAQRIVADVRAEFDVVGLTIAEFIPRQVMHLTTLVADFPLVNGRP